MKNLLMALWFIVASFKVFGAAWMTSAFGFALVCMLCACGKGVMAPGQVDPEFNHYVITFNLEANQHGSDVKADGISIQFGNLNNVDTSNERGVCNLGDSRSITIDTNGWKQLSDSEKEELIFHELGHCALNLEHDNQMVMGTDGFIAESLMNKTLPGWGTYQTNREEYLNRLFQ